MKWEDVGGLEEAKREILDVVKMPFDHPELFSRSGHYKANFYVYFFLQKVGRGNILVLSVQECREQCYLPTHLSSLLKILVWPAADSFSSRSGGYPSQKF